jgi:hypothetical protein
MSDALDQAVELVLSVLGGEVVSDDVESVVFMEPHRRRRVRKLAQPSPDQAGLFDEC